MERQRPTRRVGHHRRGRRPRPLRQRQPRRDARGAGGLTPREPRRWEIAVAGLAATAATAFACIALAAVVGLSRCGGFFGESSAVPGTLSQQICNRNLGLVLFWIEALAPVLGGVIGVLLALRRPAHRTWARPLIAGAAVSLAVTVLIAVSGEF